MELSEIRIEALPIPAPSEPINQCFRETESDPISEISSSIVKNNPEFLNEWNFPMKVKFRFLDLSTSNTVGCGAQIVQTKNIKCKTMAPNLWFCAPFRNK